MAHLRDVKHNYLRYGNCWEDADVLLEGLNIQPKDRVLSIGSAGDNCLSLLSKNPEIVVAVDINRAQLNIIELKKAAISALDYSSFLQFLGFHHSSNRLTLFEKVKPHLSLDLQAYWSERSSEIVAGIIHQGKFECYFNLFRTRVLPLVHSKHRIAALLQEKEAQQQKQFFTQKWNNWRWRFLFNVFFSKFVMGRFGRDPQFLKEVNVPVSPFILKQTEMHFCSVSCQNNYFLRYILQGEFGQLLPHYAREENFELIKNNLGKLVLFNGFAERAVKQFPPFNKFNLSDIFEYMDIPTFSSASKKLVKNASEKSRFAYWNLLVPRQMSEVVANLNQNKLLSKQLTNKDNGFFYSEILIDEKQ